MWQLQPLVLLFKIPDIPMARIFTVLYVIGHQAIVCAFYDQTESERHTWHIGSPTFQGE